LRTGRWLCIVVPIRSRQTVLPLTDPADLPSVGSNSQARDASGANPELRRQLFQLSSGRFVGYDSRLVGNYHSVNSRLAGSDWTA
jgi:hypothetical protein